MQEHYLAAYDRAGQRALCLEGEPPKAPLVMRDTYPLGTDDTKGKTFLATASVVGRAGEREENLAFEILANILFNSDASPLKNARLAPRHAVSGHDRVERMVQVGVRHVEIDETTLAEGGDREGFEGRHGRLDVGLYGPERQGGVGGL